MKMAEDVLIKGGSTRFAVAFTDPFPNVVAFEFAATDKRRKALADDITVLPTMTHYTGDPDEPPSIYRF
ncbi:hypothetical protein WG66_013092 [Moniliophthora roreri]|nr:hypothetical protein WG66_013092 [Moniliophthora roreri]